MEVDEVMQSLENKRLTVVAIGAHPDPFDMPYQAGGTLAKYARRGHEVILVSAAFEPEWAEEVEAMATHLGGSQRWLGFEEGAVFDDPAQTQRIMALLRQTRPDVVITHQPRDYHPDHRALSRAVLGACLLSRVDEIESDHPPHKIGNLFYSETTSGLSSEGSIHVDVAETWEQKMAALRLHKGLSERAGVAHLESIEHLIEREETVMRFRGFQVERDYCEVFVPAVNYRVTWAHELLPIATLPPIED
ncbi:MAG: PIG-L family deacetylase [Actinomycetota bacterium]|nr:PIG-L family deacetylase [Actinomycetota bacterium]